MIEDTHNDGCVCFTCDIKILPWDFESELGRIYYDSVKNSTGPNSDCMNCHQSMGVHDSHAECDGGSLFYNPHARRWLSERMGGIKI